MSAQDPIWKPNVTVAAVLERDGRFLLVEGIIRAAWLTAEEIRGHGARHRSPLVMRCVEDYLAGKRYPLGLITHY